MAEQSSAGVRTVLSIVLPSGGLEEVLAHPREIEGEGLSLPHAHAGDGSRSGRDRRATRASRSGSLRARESSRAPGWRMGASARVHRLRREATGRIVAALDRLLGDNPDDDAAVKRGGEIWLPDT